MSTSSLGEVPPGKWLVWGAAATILGIAIFWVISLWQYPPAVEFSNLRYIQLLRTAVSSERADWLEKVKSAIKGRVAEGAMSEQELAHFNRVIALAETGKWTEADKMCLRFEEAQLSRRRSPPRESAHQHQHQH